MISIREKNKLYKKFIRIKQPDAEDKYKRFKNSLTSRLRDAKKKYFHTQFELVKHDLRKTWNLINNKSLFKNANRSSSNITLLEKSNMITDSMAVASTFNDFFINIGPSLAKLIPTSTTDPISYLPQPNVSSLFLNPTTALEVINITASLKPTASCGYDDLSPRVIRSVINHIAVPLSKVFNLAFTTGSFPDKLKIAKVTPVFKSDNKQDKSNYRPISVLPFFQKYLKNLFNLVYYIS